MFYMFQLFGRYFFNIRIPRERLTALLSYFFVCLLQCVLMIFAHNVHCIIHFTFILMLC